LQKTTNGAQLYNSGHKATQDLADMNEHVYSLYKGMQIAVTLAINSAFYTQF